MPEESEKKESIQLLPEKKFEELPLTKKLTTWIINVGRVVIIVTELIAFSVFVGRIKLDRELTDLTDALENQLIILKNAEDFKRDFKDLQERLKIIKEPRESQIPTGKTISLLSPLLPKEVEITGLTLGKDKSSLIVKTSSATAFAQTVYNLKSSPKIEEIALTSGRFDAEDGTYHFSLSIKFGI